MWTLAPPLHAHDPITTKITWSREVSRIVYLRCLSCHRAGGAAFSLARYEEARPWAVAIKEEVLLRRMPPWNAVKGFGRFRDERSLTQQELATIADWVEGGAPEGDPRDLPPRPPETPLPQHRAPRKVTVADGAVLVHRVAAAGISIPKDLPNTTLQVVAVRPDGSVEPLVWIRRTNVADEGVYWFRERVDLPAGTRIQTVPANGSASLLAR
jgi:hypothetical protein